MALIATGLSLEWAILHFLMCFLKINLTVAECPLVFEHVFSVLLALFDDVLVVALVDFVDQDALDFFSEMGVLRLGVLW